MLRMIFLQPVRADCSRPSTAFVNLPTPVDYVLVQVVIRARRWSKSGVFVRIAHKTVNELIPEDLRLEILLSPPLFAHP
jgi:hypothetical protein